MKILNNILFTLLVVGIISILPINMGITIQNPSMNASSSITPQILGYNILEQYSNITMNTGGSIYVYTAVDGGGVPIYDENFNNVANVTDGNGVIAADFGYSNNNVGSYNPDHAAEFAIGGISVGSKDGINYGMPKTVFYSINGSYGADQTALNFSVINNDSLVVIVGAGSSDSNPVLAGNFSINMMDELNSAISIIQAYSYLNKGNFSVKIAMNTNGTNLGGCSVILGVFVFSPSYFYPQAEYHVNFIESGLPPNTYWYITVDGIQYSSSNNTIAIKEYNGTYYFDVPDEDGFHPVPQNGNVTVDGHYVSISITFVPPSEYSLTFIPENLPGNYAWWVSVDNITKNSSGSNDIIFTLLNGTYSFKIGVQKGYEPISSIGTVTISGGSVTQDVVFIPEQFILKVIERGLPNGQTWSVILNGKEYTSTNSTILIYVINGNYTLTILNIQGYKPQKDLITFTIDNSNKSILVQYNFISPASMSPYESPALLLIASALVFIIFGLISYLLLRGGKNVL